MVHTALLIVPPESVIDESQMPLMSPPAYCMSHVASALAASIWKKSAALQSPVYVPDIVIVSPASQSAEAPPAQFAATDAEIRLQAEGWVVVVVVVVVVVGSVVVVVVVVVGLVVVVVDVVVVDVVVIHPEGHDGGFSFLCSQPDSQQHQYVNSTVLLGAYVHEPPAQQLFHTAAFASSATLTNVERSITASKNTLDASSFSLVPIFIPICNSFPANIKSCGGLSRLLPVTSFSSSPRRASS